MKKYFVLIVVIAMLLALSSCGGDDKAVSDEQSAASNPKPAFEQMEQTLDDMGVKYEKIVTAAELVGAEQGMKYELADGNVELYRFDPNGDAFKKAKETKSIELEDFGAFPAEIHGSLPFALTIDDVDKKDDIVSAFNNFK